MKFQWIAKFECMWSPGGKPTAAVVPSLESLSQQLQDENAVFDLLKLLHASQNFVNSMKVSSINNGSPSGVKIRRMGGKSGPILRPYQLEGVSWMKSLHDNGLNGILADEMGLGKTIQVMTHLQQLYESFGVSGPHLIIAPLTVLSAWQNELDKYFVGQFHVYVHHGTQQQRVDNFMAWKNDVSNALKRGTTQGIHLLLTSYEICLRDIDLFKRLGGRLQWYCMVVDEAHRLKNCRGFSYRQLVNVQARFRILLTGTPLQNGLNELWALLGFVLPTLFGNADLLPLWFNRPFEERFKELQLSLPVGTIPPPASMGGDQKKLLRAERDLILRSLRTVIEPFLLRRLKREVALDLPRKVGRVIVCPLSPLQIHVHELVREAVLAQLQGASSNCKIKLLSLKSASVQSGGGQAQAEIKLDEVHRKLYSRNILMQLRKLCNHPYLLLETLRTIPDDLYFRQLLGTSGKLLVLDQLLQQLLQDGHKVLVFCQMTSMLDIIQGMLLYRHGLHCYRIDGQTKMEDRVTQVRKFNDMPSATSSSSSEMDDMNDTATTVENEVRIFLLCTRAGGVGLNLQAADTVILFDSDWNPQMDLQAAARAHRLGQTKPVLVLRLVSAASPAYVGQESVEQLQLRRAQVKLETERLIFNKSSNSSSSANSMNDDEVEQLDKDEEELAEMQGMVSSNDNKTTDGFSTASESPDLAEPDAEPELEDMDTDTFRCLFDGTAIDNSASSPSPSLSNSSQELNKESLHRLLYRGEQEDTESVIPSGIVTSFSNGHPVYFIADSIFSLAVRAAAEQASEHQHLQIDMDMEAWTPWLSPGGNEYYNSNGREFLDSPIHPADLNNPQRASRSQHHLSARSGSSPMFVSLNDGKDSSDSGSDDSFERARKRRNRRHRQPHGQQYVAASDDAESEDTSSSDENNGSEDLWLRKARKCANTKRVRLRNIRLSQYEIPAEHGIIDVLPQHFPPQNEHFSNSSSAGHMQLTPPRRRRRKQDKDERKERKENRNEDKEMKKKKRRKKESSELQQELQEEEYDNDFCAICGEGDMGTPLVKLTDDQQPQHQLQQQVWKRNTLVLCDSCDGGFHLSCVGLEDVPQGDWFCRVCQMLG